MCNYALARIHPEMDKLRRVVVVSPRSYNRRHGKGPGRCLVIPFTATDPAANMTMADVRFPAGSYKCLTVETWAICNAAMSLSHTRLDRVYVSGAYADEVLTSGDMLRIEEGLRHALGLPDLHEP